MPDGPLLDFLLVSSLLFVTWTLTLGITAFIDIIRLSLGKKPWFNEIKED